MSPCRTDDDDDEQGRLSFTIFCLLLILILVSLNWKSKPIYLKLHYKLGPNFTLGCDAGLSFNANALKIFSAPELCATKRRGEGGGKGVGDIELSIGDKFSVCESFGCGGGATRAIIADIFVNQPCLLNTFQ